MRRQEIGDRRRRRSDAGADGRTVASLRRPRDPDRVGPAPPRLRVWRPFPRSHLDVICRDHVALEVPPQPHEELQLVIPRSTVYVVDGVGRRDMLRPGSIGVVNPAERTGLIAAGKRPGRVAVLLLAVDDLRRIGAEAAQLSPGQAPWFPRRVILDEGLAADFEGIVAELHGQVVAGACEARLRHCLARLVGRHARQPHPLTSGQPRRRIGVARVRTFLRAHVTESVSIEDLARLAGLSKFYLLRAFVGEEGVSPHVYQMELRLARARTLLARGASPSFAAHAAGFADQSHLTRRLRSACGLTPAAYARQFAAGGVAGGGRSRESGSACLPSAA